MNDRIVGLKVQNVKKIVAVQVNDLGNSVTVGGKNGNGKSSLLDSIMYALSGGKSQPDQVIRRGQDKAVIELQLTDLVIKKVITEKGDKLTVQYKDGRPVSSPQTFLSTLVDKEGLAFDPVAFAEMDSKKQVEVIRKLVGLDTTEIDNQINDLYYQRRQAKKELDEAEKQLAGMPVHQNIPATPIDIEGVSHQLVEAEKWNHEVQSTRTHINHLKENIDKLMEELSKLTEHLGNLEESEFAKGDIKDTSVLSTQLSDASAINQKISDMAARRKKSDEVARKRAAAQAIERQFTDLAQAKQDMISALKFPIDSMSFGETGLLLNGLPFDRDQLGQTEYLRACTRIAFSLCPAQGLKIALIRTASLMDADNRAAVIEEAKAIGAQPWLEIVTDDKDTVDLFIEEGELK